MDETVSAAEANCSFSRPLTETGEGRRSIVTSHAHPVAPLARVSMAEEEAADARTDLLRRLAQEPAVTVDRWSRDELYEDER